MDTNGRVGGGGTRNDSMIEFKLRGAPRAGMPAPPTSPAKSFKSAAEPTYKCSRWS